MTIRHFVLNYFIFTDAVKKRPLKNKVNQVHKVNLCYFLLILIRQMVQHSTTAFRNTVFLRKLCCFLEILFPFSCLSLWITFVSIWLRRRNLIFDLNRIFFRFKLERFNAGFFFQLIFQFFNTIRINLCLWILVITLRRWWIDFIIG